MYGATAIRDPSAEIASFSTGASAPNVANSLPVFASHTRTGVFSGASRVAVTSTLPSDENA